MKLIDLFRVNKERINLAKNILLRYKFLLYFNIFILLLSAAFEGVGIGMLIPVLQSIEGNANGGIFVDWATYIFEFLSIEYNPINLLIFFGILILTRFILLIIGQRISRVLSSTITRDLRSASLSNLVDTSITYFYNKKIGDLVATVFNSTQNSGGFVEYLLLAVKGIIFCLAYVVVASLISIELTLFIIGVVLLAYVIVWPRFKKSQRFGETEKSLMDEIISSTQDRFSGIRVIKSFNKEDVIKREFQNKVDSYRKNDIRIMDNKLVAYAFFEPFLFVLLIFGIIFSLTYLDLPLENLIVSLLVFTLIIPQFKLVNTNIMVIRQLFPHFERVEDLISTKDKSYIKEGKRSIKSINGDIELRDISFSYSKNGQKTLDDINLSFNSRSSVGLVGPSGGGKSTLADIILRNLEPDTGKILVSGIDLSEASLSDWKALTALVDQDPYLFQGSINENIKFFTDRVNVSSIEEASKQAFAHHFISNLENGYDTQIGLRGLSLSGGQRQRISLARALIRNPQLLILDEATSALDSESEMEIQETLETLKEGITLIVIAHKLSTIKNLDKIVFLENGKIKEVGTHEELLGKNGLYKKFVELEFKNKS